MSSIAFKHTVTERFLRYVTIDTQSDASSPTCPSTEKQKNLGRLLAEELRAENRLLDKDAFRAAATRVRERTGQKGKALFHPIRLVLTGEPEGLELDLAVPAIEAGASLQASGIRPIPGAAERAREFASALSRS